MLQLLVLPCLLCACPRGTSGSGGPASAAAPIPSSGFKADLAVHREPTGMFMGKPSGPPAGQYPHPDWPGAVYWTTQQARVDEFGLDGTGIVRSYVSDTASLTHYTFSPNATSKLAQAWWLKGGAPLPGRVSNALAYKLPFSVLGLDKDFLLTQFRASPELQLKDLGAKEIRGEACTGIELAIPMEEPAQIWFSQRHGVPWQIDCTAMGGSNRYSVGISGVTAWTPDAAWLAVPAGFRLGDMRK
jgi:hypothetical protein